MKETDIPAKAKEMGFDALEFAGISPPEGVAALDYAAQLRDIAAGCGIPLIAYAIGADFLGGSGGDLKKEIERVCREVDVAKALGVPLMRHDATWGVPKEWKDGKSFCANVNRLAEGCREVTKYAEGLGIRTTVENHGYYCQDSERVEMLVDTVRHPNFGVLLDVGNFACADEDSGVAVGRLLPYTFHCHVKDFHIKSGNGIAPGNGWFTSRGGNFLRGAIVGHGDIPVSQCLRLIKNAGYAGAVSLEFEGMEDPIQGIALGLENLRRFIA
jgi:sugar phosphate isomerase/epimerase